jgi:ergothioneine biosynthesis protein EgtB
MYYLPGKILNMKTESKNNNSVQDDIVSYFRRVRYDSELICEPLEIEDYGIQTMPEVSPPKWHLAHTSWFFETLLLKPYYKDYKEYNSNYTVLFNSYYDTIGTYHPRHLRGILSRPTVKEIYLYRHYIDNKMLELLSQESSTQYHEVISRTILGLNHEQQHQELLLTDIKHIFFSNPLLPTYKKVNLPSNVTLVDENQHEFKWVNFDGGVKIIGFNGDAFSYDNETPQHKTFINNFQLASRPVSNGEYLDFINAGGYQQVSLWLSDAWKILQQNDWQAPLYWKKSDNDWCYMTLSGIKNIDKSAPVCHVSYFEAAAYARWYSEQHPGVRLATEAEWEIAARSCTIEGNFRDTENLQPQVSQKSISYSPLQQMYGDVWEWTQSAYSAYPGYFAAAGALGEYNGKFMSSQIVLRGGSCATAQDHIRPSYRNFFYPHERWQFSGFRLAKDLI